MEKNTRSLDWKQEKLRGSTVRCARGHLRGKPWLRYIFSWEHIFFRGLTKKFIFFGESHNSENFTKKYSLSYWSRALSNFSFLVFRFSGPHKERPQDLFFDVMPCSVSVSLSSNHIKPYCSDLRRTSLDFTLQLRQTSSSIQCLQRSQFWL